MTKLSQFLSTALLVLSMATLTWAGDTQGPALPSPPPPPAECTTSCANSQTALPAPDATVDLVNELVTWLIASIL
jgi:hypothetical protein